MRERFAGKVCLITGAGSGITAAVTLRLASESASVLGVDIDADRLAETQRLACDTVIAVEVRQADLGEPDECAPPFGRASTSSGGLDVLGNVAGIYHGHATDLTVERSTGALKETNLDACLFPAQAAIPHLLADGGNIVNIAPNAGCRASRTPWLTASARRRTQLTRALAVEYLKTPLRVNAIAPAGTNTRQPGDPVQLLRTWTPTSPGGWAGLRGMAEPDEVAAFALASDEARSITGAIYTVDNGLTAS